MNGGRDGFTLLEIVLALAVLAGAIAALGEVLRLADESAQKAHAETQSQLLASSVMNELLTGVRELSNVSDAPFELDTVPPWSYSVSVDATEMQALITVRVRVAQKLPPQQRPVAFELVRWMLNPDVVEEVEAEAAASTTSS